MLGAHDFGMSRSACAQTSAAPRSPAPPSGLSPAAVALLNAIARVSAPVDPWADYPPVLGVRQVAEILGMQAPAVSEAARRGAIPMVKVCGKWRIDQVEFRKFCGYRESVPVAPVS